MPASDFYLLESCSAKPASRPPIGLKLLILRIKIIPVKPVPSKDPRNAATKTSKAVTVYHLVLLHKQVKQRKQL